jgi:hypothetical protein
VWDIDNIIRKNNQAALDWMMRGQRMEAAQGPKPEAWALSILADNMVTGPPSLTHLTFVFTDPEVTQKFIQLIRKFLPEHEKTIMAEARNRRVYKFCHLFSGLYYELSAESYQYSMSYFVSGMPVDLVGLSYSAYHDLEMSRGYLLLLSLVVYPYEGDERDEEDDDLPFDPGKLANTEYTPTASHIKWVRDLVTSLSIGGVWVAPQGFRVTKKAENSIEISQAVDDLAVKEIINITIILARKAGIEVTFSRSGRTSKEIMSAARVPLLDKVSAIVGTELAARIPSDGWTPEELHIMTANTLFAGLGEFADWACGITGCVVLDANYDHPGYEEGDYEPTFQWSRYNVKLMTDQWPKVKEIRAEIDRIVEWIEVDSTARFQELLEYLLSQPRPKVETKHRKYEIWGGTELEQVMQDYYGEEEDDIDDTTGIPSTAGRV